MNNIYFILSLWSICPQTRRHVFALLSNYTRGFSTLQPTGVMYYIRLRITVANV